MAISASVFLSTWREKGVILYEVNPRYHTKETPIVLGYCHGVSRYYHLPEHREQLVADSEKDLPGLQDWLEGLTRPDRSPQPEPAPKAQADSWDPAAHPPIL
jgi:hypothetical protein